MSWLKNNATKSANYAWILDIRKRFFLRQDALPLKQLLKPTK